MTCLWFPDAVVNSNITVVKIFYILEIGTNRSSLQPSDRFDWGCRRVSDFMSRGDKGIEYLMLKLQRC